jgi:hypothetical protein
MATFRSKIFLKLAQTTDATSTPSTPPTTQTTTSTAPTTVAGAPQSVSVNTYFQSFQQAWGSQYTSLVDTMLNALNWSIFILSIGALSFDQLRQQAFSFDISKYPDPFLTGMIMVSRSVFNTMLNGGKPFKTQISIADKIKILNELLQQISSNIKIPDAPNNSFPQSYLQTRIGNPKTILITLLNQMKAITK